MPMTTLTPVDEFSEPVQVEANGTVISKEGIGDLGLQRLTNQGTFLRNRTFGTEDGEIVPIPLVPMLADLWTFGEADSGALAFCQDDVAASRDIWFELPQLKLATLIRITARLLGSTGHAGTPVATTMPKLTLYRQPTGTDAIPVEVATVSDTATAPAAYEVGHSIALTGLTEAMDPDGTVRYFIKFEGETGGNAQANLALLDLYATLDVT